MKKKIVIISLTFLALIILGIIFSIAIYDFKIVNFNTDSDFSESVVGKEIADPDRIVYKDSDGNYYEFLKDTKKYNTLKALLGNSIKSYNKKGEILTDENIDELHSKSFIEFDYKTASKNYIINLEKNENRAVVKLEDTGGIVISKNIDNLNKIKRTLKTLIDGEKAQKLEYKEIYSINQINGIEYKYQQLFKNNSTYKRYQAKITNLSDYDKFKQICNIAIDEQIDEELFLNNDIILTVSELPKIDVKVSVGNIKYNYSNIANANRQYTVHLLIVSKIVNTDCVYNTDLSDLESKIEYENMKIEYDNNVENLDENIFVTDFEKFAQEYNLASSKCTEEDATKIAELGFKEAERICGSYDVSTQKITKEVVKPNNFLTRKTNEYDKVYSQLDVEAYIFTRVDDMELNGVKIYVDTRLGKIIGGEAFGD